VDLPIIGWRFQIASEICSDAHDRYGRDGRNIFVFDYSDTPGAAVKPHVRVCDAGSRGGVRDRSSPGVHPDGLDVRPRIIVRTPQPSAEFG